MRVAMIVGNDLTRDSRVRREARALVAAGHDVTLYGVASEGTEAEEDDHGVVLVRVPLPDWTASGSGLPGAIRVARWYDRFEPLVRHALLRAPPDVIHAHDLDTLAPALRAARRHGVRVVYDDHEASYTDKLPNYVPRDASGAKGAVLRGAVKWLQRRGRAIETRARRQGLDGVITVSDALADRLHERLGGDRPVVVRNIPDHREVERTDDLRRRAGAYPDDRLLLYHGVVTEGRGVETAVRALRLLGPGHFLVVLGWAWRPDLLHGVAEAEGVADRIRLLDAVPEDEMFRLIAGADVGLVTTEPTSTSYLYSLPNKLFESIMAGLPVVSTDLPEAGRLVRDTGVGVVYPARTPGDPEELALAIRTLLADDVLRETCRERALTVARDELNWEVESRRLAGLYETLADA